MPFTDEEKKLIHRGINAVWSEIAYEVIEANDGRPIPKHEVIELCLDASRLYDARPHGVDRAEWKALVKRFYALSIDEMNKIAEGFSQYKRFGI